jgi:tRNA dimethylallyltransferase
MLYFRTLQYGLSELPSADAKIRRRLEEQGRVHGWDTLHDRLREVDPAAAARIHPNDPQRIQRALEVFEITGRPMSELLASRPAVELPYTVYKLAILPAERAQLHERIARRFGQMLELGLLDEVKALYERGDLHEGLPAIRSVGYRQLWDYLAGRCAQQRAIERAIVATRQLAKRQLTWLRAEPHLERLQAPDKHIIDKALKFLGNVPISI